MLYPEPHINHKIIKKIMKTLIIIRACSGAGKTTFAETIQLLNPEEVVVCCADDYFTDADGKYNFDPTKLHAAHRECQLKALLAMERGMRVVIIANTNTKTKDFKAYEQYAVANSYQIHYPVLENRHGKIDVHGVGVDIRNRQENALRMNLKLQ